jgi:hypothetical protein
MLTGRRLRRVQACGWLVALAMLLAWMLGGSGMRSMLAKRNAMGQLVKASTRLGDREVGTGKLTAASLRKGCAPVERVSAGLVSVGLVSVGRGSRR